MMTLLPGYAYFRYPAKLLTLVSLAASQLSASGVDRLPQQSPHSRLPRVLLLLALGSLIVGCTIAFLGAANCADYSYRLLARSKALDGGVKWAPSDALFGPFDAAGAHRDVVFALLQTALVASIGYIAAARFAVAPGTPSGGNW